MCRNDWIKGEKNMMEKILLGSSYLAQAIVMATIAFAVISTIYYLRYNKKIICQPGWIIKYIFLVYIATVGMVTRVLDITSWSYGGFTAWNIVPFVNESWKLMLLNKMELWKSNNCRGIDIFDDRVCTSCICRKNW